MNKVIASFRYAVAGLLHAILHERNMRLHIVAAVCVTVIMPYYKLTRGEVIVVSLVITSVMVCELLNTALERCVNLFQPEHHPVAGAAKDVAAAAVLISAIGAIVCFIVMFANPLLWTALRGLTATPTRIALCVVGAVAALVFVFGIQD